MKDTGGSGRVPPANIFWLFAGSVIVREALQPARIDAPVGVTATSGRFGRRGGFPASGNFVDAST